ncbi:hypothetical protein KR200_000065 [Drosophila serrata]|nr:hypothetical protein KR200_000065 [Drosophila serrata]
MVTFDLGPKPKTLLIWAYVIGCFDLIAASLFTVMGLRMIKERLSWLTISAILFGGFWISMIMMLLIGVRGRRPMYVRNWIIFSCMGILTESCFFLYGILSECCFQEGLIRNGILLIVALFVEFIFLYIVHRFYLTLSRCEPCHKPRAREPENECELNQKEGVVSTQAHPTVPSFPYQYSMGNIHDATLANPMKLSQLRVVDSHSAP